MTIMDDDDVHEEDARVTMSAHVPTTTNHDSCDDYSRLSEVSNAAELVGNTDLYKCYGCNKPIFDQYYSWVDNRSWHEKCVQCSVCRQALVDSCYTKNCQLYCPQDYKQLQVCRRCSRVISGEELMQRVGGLAFHSLCFVCDICHKQLQSGDQYVIDNSTNQINCKTCKDQGDDIMLLSHYCHDNDSASDSERSDDDVFSHQSSQMSGLGHMHGFVTSGGFQHPHGLMGTKAGSKSSPSLSMITTTVDGKRVKRPRTILTTAQRRKFKASFEVSQKPCRKVRETLAAETGLSPRVVQVWFQNQRAKIKKLARRQQDGSRGSRGNRSRRKKTTDSDSDNDLLSSPGSYVSMPTPHQNSLYHDTYRSPGSIQTSPVTSAPESSHYFHTTPPTHEGPELLYEDFDSNPLSGDPTHDVYLPAAPHTSSGPSSSLNMEARLHVDMATSMADFNNSSGTINLDSDLIPGVSPQNTFVPPQTLTPFPNQSTAEGNPIDRLMCMQNNFFRT